MYAGLANFVALTRSAIAFVLTVVVAVHSTAAEERAGSGALQTMEATESGIVLRVTVAVDRTDVSVADRVTLTIRVDSPIGVVVQIPKLNEIAGFTHVSTTESDGELPGASTTTRTHRVVLEPFLAGEKAIPAFEITGRAPGGKGPAGSIQAKPAVVRITSQPIPVVVRAIAPADANAQTPLKSGPIVLPSPPSEQASQKLILAIAVGTGLAMAITGGVLVARRRSEREPSPFEVTREQLERLAALASKAPMSSHAATELARVLREHCVHGLRLSTPGGSNAELARELRALGWLPERERVEGAALLRQLEELAFVPKGLGVSEPSSEGEMIARAQEWVRTCQMLAPSTGGESK